jgi:hypothetical protein
MGVPRTCSTLFSLVSCTSNVIGPVICVYGFIMCSHNIKFNIAEIVKRVKVVQIKCNEIANYIIHTTQHMKWHVRTYTKLGYKGPGLNLTRLR